MKYDIDPMVDCVFKAILGQDSNKNLLINFLNAVLDLNEENAINHVDILNPYNDKTSFDGKQTIVDIKATDNLKRRFQIEVQTSVRNHLPLRMLYTHAHLISSQLEEGDDYDKIDPSISIWLLKENLFPQSEHYHHCMTTHDALHDLTLCEETAIHVFELKKWDRLPIEKPIDMWLKFFKEANTLDDEALPDNMNNPVIKQALSTMKHFTDDEIARDIYQRRLDYRRCQGAMKREMEALASEMEAAKSDLASTQADLDNTKVDLDNTKVDLDNTKVDLDNTKVDLDNTKVDLDNTKVDLDNTKVDLDNTKTELNNAQADLNSTKGDLARAEAESRALRDKLLELGIDPDSITP